MDDGRQRNEDRRMTDVYKFQKLDVYKLALDYGKAIYLLRQNMPDYERFNITNQIERAVS